MHVSVCTGYALTISFNIGLFHFKWRLCASGVHKCTCCFPWGILPLESQCMVLILICATLEIYSKMGPISITSRHATLTLQMISELEFPYWQATSPTAFLMFQSKNCTSFLALISFPICYFLWKRNQTCNILDSRQEAKCWSGKQSGINLGSHNCKLFPSGHNFNFL